MAAERPANEESAAPIGATGVFATLPAANDPALAPATGHEALPARSPVLPQPVAGTLRAEVPAVHEVRFDPTGSQGGTAEDALQRLLRDSPPANPATSAGDFTRILRALSPQDSLKPANSSETSIWPGSATPTVGSDAYEVAHREIPVIRSPAALEASSSFTQMLQALGTQTSAAAAENASVLPTMVMPDAQTANRHSEQAVPKATHPSHAPCPKVNVVEPSTATDASAVNPAALAVNDAGPGSPFTQIFETVSSGSDGSSPTSGSMNRENPSSFTRIINAIGNSPSGVPSQADAAPPWLQAPPGVLPKSQPQSPENLISTFSPYPVNAPLDPLSGPSAPASPPLVPYSSPIAGDGLTKLIQALGRPAYQPSRSPHETRREEPPAVQGFPESFRSADARVPIYPSASEPLPAFGLKGMSAPSGSTASFHTPSAAPPAPVGATGPGEYTRVFQTPSHNASQSPSTAAPPTSPPAPPGSIASSLPPWSLPPAPALPPLQSLAHRGGSGEGLALPQVPMPTLPRPQISALPTQAATGKQPVLVVVLLAIIAVLLATLIAVILLHKP